ncbi:MAG: hypothetical protein ACREMY_33855 [bacterium]
MIAIDPKVNGDPGVPAHPYFVLQSINQSALSFSVMLIGTLTGFRIAKAEK